MTRIVQMRCPNDGRRLFGKVLLEPDDKPEPSFTIQFSCRECRKASEKAGDVVDMILHYYDSCGRFVRTEVIRAPSSMRPLDSISNTSD